MQRLTYSINVTLDGCIDHQAIVPDKEMHMRATESLAGADALIFGRVTYELMEAGWREVSETGIKPDWMADWMMPFAEMIGPKKKYVVSGTLRSVDWNAELVQPDAIEPTVRRLKAQEGRGLYVGGVKLPMTLAGMGLIDAYEFIVHPRIVGHGPRLFEGMSKPLDLTLVDRLEYGSGAMALRYEPKR